MSEASVLVVDDEEYIRDLVTSSLRLAGFAARSVSDGSKALAAVAADPPDLVVLDVRMPGIDGFEVCHRLRASAGRRALTAMRPHRGPDLILCSRIMPMQNE